MTLEQIKPAFEARFNVELRVKQDEDTGQLLHGRWKCFVRYGCSLMFCLWSMSKYWLEAFEAIVGTEGFGPVVTLYKSGRQRSHEGRSYRST